MIEPEEPAREEKQPPKRISDELLKRNLEIFGGWEFAKPPAQPTPEPCAAEARQHRSHRSGGPRR